MERVITVRDMRERYGCSGPTARKYLRQIVPHMENPLSAPEWAFNEWENSRVAATQTGRRTRKAEVQRRTQRVIVPRKR